MLRFLGVIATSSAVLFASVNVLLALLRTDNKLPDPPTTILIYLTTFAAIVSASIIALMLVALIVIGLLRAARWATSKLGIIFYRKDAHPWQWMINRANSDRDHPAQGFRLMDCRVVTMDRDSPRPSTEFAIRTFNASVYTVTTSDLRGQGTWNGVPIGEEITDDHGGNTWPPLHEAEFRVRQYLRADIKQAVFDQLDRTGKLTTLSLSNVTINVAVNTEGGKSNRVALQWPSGFIRS